MTGPSAKDSERAQAAVRALSSGQSGPTVRMCLEEAGEEVSVSVPRVAFDLFLGILEQIAKGNAVAVVSVHGELTTQQAADMLNVSRPFLVRLLDDGRIPFRKVGRHRRVKVADLLVYRDKDAERRKAALDELTAKHGFGYPEEATKRS